MATKRELVDTGENGVALAIAHRPDVIVTDIRLPDISGYEVLRRLKSAPETKDIPVLALSAEATKYDVSRGHDAGFVHYMTKPFAVDELLAAVREAIGRRAADSADENPMIDRDPVSGVGVRS